MWVLFGVRKLLAGPTSTRKEPTVFPFRALGVIYIYNIYSIFVGRIKTLEFVFGRFWGSKGIEVEKTTSMILPKTKKRNPKGKVISQAAILSKAG